MTENEILPRIPEFFAGRSIFVTGFTGYMGKALVEKLLWSCSDLHRIFVLIRDKRGMTVQQRLDKITSSDVFERVRERFGDELKNKLIPVKGDVVEPGLGISAEDRRVLCDEVSIIFHCAASVRFEDPLTTALDINVKGTKSVVDLALEMPKLVCFLHVSTAYSNCDRFEIEEKIYPPTADWRQTLLIREKIPKNIFCTLSSKYMNHMANTYVFAKSLCEHVVADHADKIPLCIYRPSIVISSLSEPFPGWFENMNGPAGLLIGYGTGVVRTSMVDDKVKPDFLPIDIAIKALIFTAYLRHYKKEEKVQLYNACSSERSVTNAEVTQIAKTVVTRRPLKIMLWKQSDHSTNSPLLFYIYFMLFQFLPAVIIDLLLRLFSRKPILLKVQRKVYRAMDALKYFTLNYFHFHNKKVYEIAKYLQEADEPEFKYIIGNFDHYAYFDNCSVYAMKKFFKMTSKDCESALKRLVFYNWADWIVKFGFYGFLVYFIYKYQVIQTLTVGALNFILNV